MATKTKKATKKGNKPSVAKKVNASLINASMAAINTTVDNGGKWQKLASKLIKKSEKVREQQINMIFDTAEAVKGQFITGTDKMKDLVGYDAELVENAKNKAMNHPMAKKVAGIVEDITEKVSENPMVQKAEKATEDLKNMGIAKYNELKGDVLEQASKIIDKGEAIIEDAKSTPKAKATKKTVSKKTIAKKVSAKKSKATKTVAKAAPKKTVAKKGTATKAKSTKTVAKAAPKKAVVKKATKTKAKATKVVAKAAPKAKAVVAKKATAVKKETVAKATEVKEVATAKVAEVKTEAKK